MIPATARMPSAVSVRGRLKAHPLLLDLGFTGAAQVSLFVSNLLLVSLFARLLSATGVAEYLLLRRVVVWLQSGVQLGLYVGIPRYVAHEVGAAEGKPETYFAAGAACLGFVAIILGLALNFWRQGFARLMFGSSQMTYLVLPVSLTILGLVLHTAIYGYFRGRLQMNRANILQIWNMSLVPVIALVLFVHLRSVAAIVNFTAVLTIATSVSVSIPTLRRAFTRGNFELRRPLKKLLTYGLARVPGDFAAAALFAVGPIIAAQFMPLKQVSPLLLGTSLLMAAAVSVAPLGVLLLSKVSVVIAQNRLQDVRQPLSYMMNGVLDLSMFMTLQFIVVADLVLRIWVGPDLLNAVPIVRIVALAIPCFLFFTALRSVIDAATVKASNAYNILVTLIAFLVLTGVSVLALPREFLLVGLSVAMVISLALLAGLTAATVRRLCAVKPEWRSFAQSLLMNVLFFGIAVAIRGLAGWGKSPAKVIPLELVVCLGYLYSLFKLRPEWLKFVLQKGFGRMPKHRIDEGLACAPTETEV